MAAGSINLSRVDISLAEFQRMSDGKYNAEAEKMKPQAEKVARLIDSGASVDDICNSIGDIFLTCKEKVCDIYKK